MSARLPAHAATSRESAAQRVHGWLADDGALARGLPGYEPRAAQREMAQAVAALAASGGVLVVEAGTGVGKSFAYLLPAIAHIRAAGARVVVSTHTIALQEQLAFKDVPAVRDLLGEPFTAELVKGRANYLGLRRLKSASSRQASLFTAERLRVLHAIEDWAYHTADGSLSDLPENPPPDVWDKVRSEHGNCLGRRCPTFEPCFYQRARRRAEQADLLIVNHALLISDLVLRRAGASILPPHDLLVIDEAHGLDSVAAEHLGLALTNTQIQYILSGLFNTRTGKGYLEHLAGDSEKRLVAQAAAECTRLFEDLVSWQAMRGRSNGRVLRPDIVDNDLSSALRSLAGALAALRDQSSSAEDQAELDAYIGRLSETAAALDAMLTQALPDHVYWIDQEQRRSSGRVALKATPLDVGPALRSELLERVRAVVLTSATLSLPGEGGFDYFLQRVGGVSAATLRVGSPFHYDEQMAVRIEAGLPDPSSYALFLPAACSAIEHQVRETGGRTFVLFTSAAMLADVAEALRAPLEADGFELLVQGGSLARSAMLDRFRSAPRCVLFGLESFWQGVDVAGEALSCVIIAKLPFVAPDRPTVEARSERMRREGRNPFKDYHLPEAVLKFRQGVGRLIRTRSDAGTVVVLDSRVVSKSYGQLFLDALPGGKVEIAKTIW